MQPRQFSGLAFGKFAAAHPAMCVEPDCTTNLRAVALLVGDYDILISQNSSITKRTGDLHIERATNRLSSWTNPNIATDAVKVFERQIRSFQEYSALLGTIYYRDQEWLVFVQDCSLRLCFSGHDIYRVESLKVLRMSDGAVDARLTQHLEEVGTCDSSAYLQTIVLQLHQEPDQQADSLNCKTDGHTARHVVWCWPHGPPEQVRLLRALECLYGQSNLFTQLRGSLGLFRPKFAQRVGPSLELHTGVG